MPLVFQYGSNATRGRLNGPKRLNGRAKERGRACAKGYDIVFDVWSQTNGCDAADLVRAKGREAWGVLYEIPDKFVRGVGTGRQKTLAQIEGRRYEEATIGVSNCQGQRVNAVTFVARHADRRTGLATSAAYVSWIVYGLRDHGVPEAYISHVAAVAIQTNMRARWRAGEETRIIRTL